MAGSTLTMQEVTNHDGPQRPKRSRRKHLDITPRAVSPFVSLKVSDRMEHEQVDIADLSAEHVLRAVPFRTFRWYPNQGHFPGFYWSSTNGDLVQYESLLEKERLRLADADLDVTAIRSQPFQITATDDSGVLRSHIPDFAVIDSELRFKVINVKNPTSLAKPKVAEAIAWADSVFVESGICHEVWTGADPVLIANNRFLSAYRHRNRYHLDDIEAARACISSATSFGEALKLLSENFSGMERPLLFHLAWAGHIDFDATTVLNELSTIRKVK
jgi:hypothetical protein